MNLISGSVVGPAFGSGGRAGLVEVNLPAAEWLGENTPFRQTVVLRGVTATSKIDLQASGEILLQLRQMGCALYAVNEDGIVTVHAIGQRPMLDLTLQATVTEVNTW